MTPYTYTSSGVSRHSRSTQGTVWCVRQYLSTYQPPTPLPRLPSTPPSTPPLSFSEGDWNFTPIIGKHRFSKYSLRVRSTKSLPPGSTTRYYATITVDGQKMFTTNVVRAVGSLP